MVGESRFGRMEADTMGSGGMEWPMGMGGLCMLRAMFTKESGRKTRQTAMEFTLILTAANMRVSGIKTNSTDSESNSGLTEPSMKAITSRE